MKSFLSLVLTLTAFSTANATIIMDGKEASVIACKTYRNFEWLAVVDFGNGKDITSRNSIRTSIEGKSGYLEARQLCIDILSTDTVVTVETQSNGDKSAISVEFKKKN